MDKFGLLLQAAGANQLQALEKTNEYTERFGLVLHQEDALALQENRKRTLQEQGRIEFGESILPKLIFAFCDSPYISQDDYVVTLERLQDIFYQYKNESLDQISDQELIDAMAAAFNGVCQGSLDYLEETSLENYARKIRYGEDLDEE